MGWALYLPEEWCEDPERRRAVKIPADVGFKTKPELDIDLVQRRACGWEIPAGPVLDDQAYGDNSELRERLHETGVEYVLSVGQVASVFAPETGLSLPKLDGKTGRSRGGCAPTASWNRSGR